MLKTLIKDITIIIIENSESCGDVWFYCNWYIKKFSLLLCQIVYGKTECEIEISKAWSKNPLFHIHLAINSIAKVDSDHKLCYKNPLAVEIFIVCDNIGLKRQL